MNFFKHRKIKRAWKEREIAPEDIFIDSANISLFDEFQFEGRLEKPIPKFYLKAVVVCVTVIAIAFGVRLYSLQVKEGDVYASWSAENRLRKEVVFANRGVIEDRNGIPLAWNEFEDEDDEMESFTEHGGSIRKYINTEGFSHLLGYTKPPKKDSSGFYYETYYRGIDGIEAYYNDMISGKNGEILVEENAKFEEQSRSVLRLPTDGQNLRLSVDARVQEVMYQAVKDLALRAGFEGGAGMMMDVSNGEVIAMVSFPEYNSQIMTDGDDSEKIQSMLQDPKNVFLNRAVSGLYTPGSTVKPFVALAALNEKLITPSKKLLSSGALVVPNPFSPNQPSIFRDWRTHGWVDMFEALAWSSNEYFFKVGGGFEDQRGLGIDKLESYTRAFGLGEKTGIDVLGESQGTIPNPRWKDSVFGEAWRLGDTYNTSIGQYGFQVSPVELLRAIGAISNGGKLVRPRLLSTSEEKTEIISFLDQNDLKIVKRGMRDSVTYGTARSINVPYIEAAAKTGTAEIGAFNAYVNSWITGFFPYENPKYAFVIVMERAPRQNTLGAPIAARTFFDSIVLVAPEYFE